MIVYYIIATIIVSQSAIYLFSYSRIKKYCELSHQSRFMKVCAIIFPVIFANIEKCYANYLLSATTRKRDMLHPKHQIKAKRVRKSIRKVKKFDFQSYFEITRNIKMKQDRFVEITKIHSMVTLLDTVLENYPQAVMMMCFMFLSIKCKNIRSLFQNNLGSLLYDTDEENNSNHNFVILTFAITTIFTLMFVVRRIR